MICVGGEALIDLVPSEPGAGPLGALRPLPGGGPYNVAITVGRLGTPVRFLSRLSTDGFGDALLARLVESGVDTSLVQRGPEPTTLAVAGIGADGSARYSFHVEGTADRLVEVPDLPDDVRIVSLGTLSLLLEPGATRYETLLRRHPGLTVLDPNIRPAMVADPAAFRARFASWLPNVGVLKLSVEDAAWLADCENGTDHDVLGSVRDWVAAGPAAAVVTHGADGLVALTATGDTIEVPTAPATVVDTIGAGDTVHGALLHWLANVGATTSDAVRSVPVDGWRDALSFAARAAAVTVSRAGAEPPYPAEIHP